MSACAAPQGQPRQKAESGRRRERGSGQATGNRTPPEGGKRRHDPSRIDWLKFSTPCEAGVPQGRRRHRPNVWCECCSLSTHCTKVRGSTSVGTDFSHTSTRPSVRAHRGRHPARSGRPRGARRKVAHRRVFQNTPEGCSETLLGTCNQRSCLKRLISATITSCRPPTPWPGVDGSLAVGFAAGGFPDCRVFRSIQK